jgi:hypothetical protein
MDKLDALHLSYYNERYGFGNMSEQLKEAKKLNPDITLDDVKNWRDKNIEKTKQLKGYNSFIASNPKEEYQIDLGFLNGDEKYIGALFCIDIFTKYATAIPIKNKQPEELLNALEFAIEDMGGKPKTIYSDNEGSFHSKLFTNYFSNNDIRFLSTNTHAAYVERLIRSIKTYIDKIVERYKKPWTNYLKML